MPIYDYRCGCGTSFERLVPGFDAPAPPCPRCAGATTKVPSVFAVGGRASAGRSQTEMPQTWRGTYDGNREYVTGLQRQWERRQRLEERHPELRGDQRPVLAHEGRFHAAPLRAGDPLPGSPPPSGAVGGGGHSHGPTGHSHGPASPGVGGHSHGPASPGTGGHSHSAASPGTGGHSHGVGATGGAAPAPPAGG